ncbi:hypothetical protein ACFQ4A_01865 [Lentibacillus salinarum]|uniref:Uncharacterized protein n=1 Tax=Lentibacillus salinarum TaxID=446820 RepID=A0ABW3ZRJ8_9BACI
MPGKEQQRIDEQMKHVGKPYALKGHMRFDEGIALKKVILLYYEKRN